MSYLSRFLYCKFVMTGVIQNVSSQRNFCFQKALVFSKTTRFELEKNKHPNFGDDDLRELLSSGGVDTDYMLVAHEEHKKYEKKVLNALDELNIETKVVDRNTINDDCINWADVIIPVGGDGTFLIAASKVRDQNKVVFGFNTNPEHSTGYLCLPKPCSAHIRDTLNDIKQGKFSWKFRTRIRITLFGNDRDKPPHSLYEKCFQGQNEPLNIVPANVTDGRIVEVLALNEVFVAEKISSRVSYFSLQVDDGKMIRTKSSGICVCTGSGSTAWNYTMNRVSHDKVSNLFSIADLCDTDINSVVNKYNSLLIFGQEEEKMCYTIRDLISTAEWPKMPDINTRSFAKKLFLTSSCIDAGLVIDGGLLYPFNTGTSAVLQTFPSDALRTISVT